MWSSSEQTIGPRTEQHCTAELGIMTYNADGDRGDELPAEGFADWLHSSTVC